jgi:hypothetical protein
MVGVIPGNTQGNATCTMEGAGLGRLYQLQQVDMQQTLLQVGVGPSGFKLQGREC